MKIKKNTTLSEQFQNSIAKLIPLLTHKYKRPLIFMAWYIGT